MGFFTIGEVGRMVGVSQSTLRLWEQRGLLKPARRNGNHRLYSPDDINLLKKIKYLVRAEGLNLAGVRHTLKQEGEPLPAVEPTAAHVAGIGAKLRTLRTERKLTLADVSRLTGLSITFLSRVETSKAKISVSTLQKLAVFYQKNLLYFFEGLSVAGAALIRAEERRVLETSERAVKMELLVGVPEFVMEPILFTVKPGGGSEGSYSHEGEEFLFMLEGCLEMWLDEAERYVLKPGDSLYFRSTLAHRWKNSGQKDAVILWVNTPPTF